MESEGQEVDKKGGVDRNSRTMPVFQGQSVQVVSNGPRVTHCPPHPTCSPNGHDGPQDGLQKNQKAEGQERGPGVDCPP
jgi:hypothetical protein